MKQRISQAAFDLIVGFEVTNKAHYDRRLCHPDWPGGSSGVTIGIGYDLGADKSLDADFGEFLLEAELVRLHRCIGKTGEQAHQAISGVRDITIPWDAAIEVFNERTLPKYIRQTLATFPGSADLLPADAFGALVSLVFNRGTSVEGERRKEMKEIQNIILAADQGGNQGVLCVKIATQFRKMKRLWHDNPDSDGDLVDRREEEARLIERSVGLDMSGKKA